MKKFVQKYTSQLKALGNKVAEAAKDFTDKKPEEKMAAVAEALRVTGENTAGPNAFGQATAASLVTLGAALTTTKDIMKHMKNGLNIKNATILAVHENLMNPKNAKYINSLNWAAHGGVTGPDTLGIENVTKEIEHAVDEISHTQRLKSSKAGKGKARGE